MAASLMASVKPDGITDPKPLDRTGKATLSRVDEQMKVGLHQHIGMDFQLEAPYHLAHAFQESEVIFLVTIDLPLFISPRENMVVGIRVL